MEYLCVNSQVPPLSQVQDNLGMVMVFALQNAVKDWLDQHVGHLQEMQQKRIEQEIAKKRALDRSLVKPLVECTGLSARDFTSIDFILFTSVPTFWCQFCVCLSHSLTFSLSFSFLLTLVLLSDCCFPSISTCACMSYITGEAVGGYTSHPRDIQCVVDEFQEKARCCGHGGQTGGKEG